MQIFLAIKHQNEELAKQTMASHLSNVEKVLMQYFERTESIN